MLGLAISLFKLIKKFEEGGERMKICDLCGEECEGSLSKMGTVKQIDLCAYHIELIEKYIEKLKEKV